jgi:hypothetical protein
MTQLDGLAFDNHCAVELLSHVSLSQISSGRGDSGSVAWANAGRARCFFRHPDEDQNGAEDDGKRILVSMKSNYAKPGKQVDFRWDEVGHYFRCTWQPEPAPKADDGIGAQDKAERVFLKLLNIAIGRELQVTNDPAAAKRYAPFVFGNMPAATRENLTPNTFRNAMAGLFDQGRIEVAKVRRAGHSVTVIVPAGEQPK